MKPWNFAGEHGLHMKIGPGNAQGYHLHYKVVVYRKNDPTRSVDFDFGLGGHDQQRAEKSGIDKLAWEMFFAWQYHCSEYLYWHEREMKEWMKKNPGQLPRMFVDTEADMDNESVYYRNEARKFRKVLGNQVAWDQLVNGWIDLGE